ncbi:VOC family protein [Dyadobacter psychrotolerans]|uniref:VOC family protein n=1 Tax=Dyadobacter psychrotolerans TaxID=2541721 RepID=A0A4R5DE11_9BACT|nr:VOC family protein [Dyadobacter psychrotolerans]TDE12019.1 VOC family protein [Dyadobacter psychrotolerans]
MSSILGLRTTIYKVPDVTLAKEWYAKAFETPPYFDEPFYVGFNIGGYELGLIPDVSPEPKSGNVVTYWGVKDIHTEFRRFIELGAKSNEIPENVGGEIMTATVKDPWDNVIGIIYNPEFVPENQL